jgi:hypothetical protein
MRSRASMNCTVHGTLRREGLPVHRLFFHGARSSTVSAGRLGARTRVTSDRCLPSDARRRGGATAPSRARRDVHVVQNSATTSSSATQARQGPLRGHRQRSQEVEERLPHMALLQTRASDGNYLVKKALDLCIQRSRQARSVAVLGPLSTSPMQQANAQPPE